MQLSFRQQLAMTLAPLCIFLVVISSVAIERMQAMGIATRLAFADAAVINTQTRQLLRASSNSSQLLHDLLLTEEQRAYDDKKKQLEQEQLAEEQVLDALLALNVDEQIKQLAKQIQEKRTMVLPVRQKILKLSNAGEVQSATLLLQKDYDNAEGDYIKSVDDFIAVTDSKVESATLTLQQNFRRTSQVILAISLVAITLAIFLSVRMARQLMQTLGGDPADAQCIVRQIAEGQLVIGFDKNVAAGSLLGSMREMVSQLVDVVQTMQSSSSAIGSASHSLAEQNRQAQGMVDQQSEASLSISAAADEISRCARAAEEKTQDSERLSLETVALAEAGTICMAESRQQIQEMFRLISNASDNVEKLAKQSESIGSIVSVIRGIAEQTNLLALNAAIEAARAGEQGRGFAVVADEVRNLASRTSEATGQITTMVDDIQSDTQQVVKHLRAASEGINNGVSSTENAASKLDDIMRSTRNSMAQISDVSQTAREQSQATETILSEICRINVLSDKVSQTVQQCLGATEHLQVLAQQLDGSVLKFRI